MCTCSVKKPATHILTQKRADGLQSCRPLATCAEHTPAWAAKLGTGETRFYTVAKITTNRNEESVDIQFNRQQFKP